MARDQQQDRAQILTATRQLNDAEAQIRQIQATLTAEMNSLAGLWQGNASRAFAQAHAQFDERFNRTRQELNSITTRLQESLQSYSATETDVTSTATSINSLLNG